MAKMINFLALANSTPIGAQTLSALSNSARRRWLTMHVMIVCFNNATRLIFPLHDATFSLTRRIHDGGGAGFCLIDVARI